MNMPPLKPLALSLLLLASPALMAAKTWKLNLKDAEISALVSEMAEITGKNFVVDPRVKGTVTVVSSRALGAGELYELFQSVLAINGFAAVPAGPVVKILPDTNGRQSGVRVDLGGISSGEQLVTRVITLQQTSANELLAALRPMMPQSAHMAAVPGANALVISDRAANADALEAVIRELDSGQVDDAIEIIPVQNGKAEDLISVLEAIETGAPVAGGNKDGNRAPGKVRIIADDRSNRLLVRGDRALRDRVRALVRNLDESPEYSNDQVRVFRLKFANARQVAEVLKGILATQDDKPLTTTTAAPGSASSSGIPTNLSSTGSSFAPRAGGTTTITIGGSSLIADETQNALIVRATARQIRQIESVLADLDRRRAQVMIQAAIVEVSGDNAAQLGVQWAYGDPSAGFGVVNFNTAGASLTNIAAGFLTNDPTKAGLGNGAAVGVGAGKSGSFVGALIQALNSVSDANLLSTPSIMTLDNQEAKIVVGQNVPFITGSTATTGSGVTNPFTTIQRQDVGITLKVTPSLSEGGVVRLDVEQEVSAVVPSSAGINSADLITSKRSIKTSILADDGQTIVLGGLVQDDVKKSVSKVPFLGDLPGVGVLFRATSESRSKRNLLVFLQPTVLRDALAAQKLTQRQYASVRRVDLGLDAEGRLTRLPANIQEIYQGGLQREDLRLRQGMKGGSPLSPADSAGSDEVQAPAPAPAPASVVIPVAQPAPVAQPVVAPAAPTAAQEPVVAPAPVAPARPVTSAPAAAPASAPAPVRQTPVQPVLTTPEPPKVYGADVAQPIVATPLPRVTEPQPVLAETPVVRSEPSAPPARFQPQTVAADPAARPFAAPAGTPAPAVTRQQPASIPRPTQPQVAPQPAPASSSTSQDATSPRMRIIRTPSGNVYYVPEPTSAP